MIGGMYNLLEKIHKLTKDPNKSFTTQQLVSLTGLCQQSIARSLNNLCKMGLLIRTEYRRYEGGRVVEYRINHDVCKQLLSELYNNDANQ